MKYSLFDIQVNGFGGVDFQKPDLSFEELQTAVGALARHETRRFFFTLITDTVENLRGKLENLARHLSANAALDEAVCGIHLEGPWLSPEPGFCGAHDPARMSNPSLADFDLLQRAAGERIRLVTLAPELPGSAEFIRELRARGVRVALGHTDADHASIDLAIESGAEFCTHLGNGIPSILHRHDNVMQRLLSKDELTAFFIPDGIHIPPEVLRNFYRVKPAGTALFTTDCMAAAGAPTGTYTIGALSVEVGESRVVRAAGTTHFAGSALEPDKIPGNLERWLGLDPHTARALISTEVAARFGVVLPVLEAT